MILYNLIKMITAVLLALFYDFTVKFIEDIPKGPCIFVANHKSILDPIALIDALDRRVFFLASKDLYKIPILNLMLNALETIPIKKNTADVNALRSALKLLKNGYSIAVFPEGGISLDKSVKKIYKGAMYLSYKSGFPIVPVGISGTDVVLPMGEYLPHTGRISVTVGKSIYPDLSLRKAESLEKMGNAVIAALNNLINYPNSK